MLSREGWGVGYSETQLHHHDPLCPYMALILQLQLALGTEKIWLKEGTIVIPFLSIIVREIAVLFQKALVVIMNVQPMIARGMS